MTTVVFQVGNDMLLATFMQTMIAAAGVTSSISVLPGRLNQMEETTNRALAACSMDDDDEDEDAETQPQQVAAEAAAADAAPGHTTAASPSKPRHSRK